MSTDKQENNPLEQLVELLVYAPVGMVYEYREVVPKLVRRGKSQVQLARVLGQMAAKQGGGGLEGTMGAVVGGAAHLLAQGLTELGTKVGLAPPDDEPEVRSRTSDVPDRSAEPEHAATAPRVAAAGASRGSLPIARYDELTAKEIISLLPELDAAQRDRIEAHETSHRNRKTVLAKLARLSEG